MAGTTQTMYKPGVYQNSLQAVPFPQHLSGYKDPLDCSHKSDKSAFIRSAADVAVLHSVCSLRVWNALEWSSDSGMPDVSCTLLFEHLYCDGAVATTGLMGPLTTSQSVFGMVCPLMPEESLESH